jgi:hypothetical protein
MGRGLVGDVVVVGSSVAKFSGGERAGGAWPGA